MTVNILRHLSYSSLADFERCPLLWAGRRLFAWGPTTDDVTLALGSMMHTALSEHHRGGDAELKLLGEITKIRKHLTDANIRGLFAALNRYQDLHSPKDGDQVAVWFEITIPGVELPFVGEFDLVRGDELGEWKTGNGRWWTQAKVDTEAQATAYYYAFLSTRKRMPSGMVYHSLTTTGSNPGTVVSFRTERRTEHLEQFEDHARQVAANIAVGALQAGCATGRCQFPNHCPNWDANALTRLSDLYQTFARARKEHDLDKSLEHGEAIETLLRERAPETKA